MLSHCGIEGNDRVDQLAKETLDQDLDPSGKCPLYRSEATSQLLHSAVGSNQVGCSCTWQKSLILWNQYWGPPKKFQHLTRAEEVVITWLLVGHTRATKSHILSQWPPNVCHHCGQTLTIDLMLLECAVLQECCDEYYTADSLNILLKTIPKTCIVEFLWEVGFFYLIWTVILYNFSLESPPIWCSLLTSTSPQSWTI